MKSLVLIVKFISKIHCLDLNAKAAASSIEFSYTLNHYAEYLVSENRSNIIHLNLIAGRQNELSLA